jgi:lipopolysaccharide transport system ATP-binding protein
VSDVFLEMSNVSKKFRKGETYDSLRDLVPALSKRLMGWKTGETLRGGEFWALKDVSFHVSKGQALGIIGSNGAGKSTALKLLSGVLRPTEGSLSMNGTFSALIEVGAGFHPDLSGRDNIFLNGTILGMRREQIKRKFDEIVDFSGLEDFIDTPVKRYSSGMYARLGFSVAAHVDPDIMLVDEVLSVGDYAFQNKCLWKMRSILREGATIVFVSHNLPAVADLCGRCLLLDHGRVAKEGEAKEIVAYYQNPGREEEENDEKEVFISKTALNSLNGKEMRFRSGEKAFFEIDVTSRGRYDKLAVAIYLTDKDGKEIFNTSTERLNCRSINLVPGETRGARFELELHLVPGIYHLGALVVRYDIRKHYDERARAATLYIEYEDDVRGVVNLYPRATIE